MRPVRRRWRQAGAKDPDHPLLQDKEPPLAARKQVVQEERGKIVTTVRAASSAKLREQVRVWSFRNVLVLTIVSMMLLATVVALVGLRSRTLIPLCFAPQQEPGRMIVVCPTNQSDPSERYGIPLALAWLKLPTGAITAFLGLLLMRGQFVPGLSALDSSAQILAWALVFGYAQQLFTRLVDQQGQTVLETVRGADKAQPTPTPP